MLIKPRIKEFICLTSNPDGCKKNVEDQIAYIQGLGKAKGPENVLLIGSSSGYGLSARIAATYACNSSTIGVIYERPEVGSRMGTAGWYNNEAFEIRAQKDGFYAESINGDAFSKEVKEKTIELIKGKLKKVDMVIYSLASPRRTMRDGTTFKSSLKTIGEKFKSKNLVLKDNTVSEIVIDSATEEEINSTIKVMGGEDWEGWIHELIKAEVLADDAVTIAFSYMGPGITYPIYREGTIGAAKKHLYETALRLNREYKKCGLRAFISMNKALVTQASSAIPIVPLYLAILYKIMKDKNIHEGCIEQMGRLFFDKLSIKREQLDDDSMIRLDDWELRSDICEEVNTVWKQINTGNLLELADLDGYWSDFYKIYGFNYMSYKK